MARAHFQPLSQSPETGSRGAAIGALVAVQVLYGIHFSVSVEISHDIPPLAWAAMRVAGAAFILALIASLGRNGWPRGWTAWRSVAVLAVFGAIGNQICFIEGISRSTSIHGILINSTVPLIALLLSAAAGHERLSAGKFAGVALGLAGVVVLLRLDQILAGELERLLLRRDGSAAESFFDTMLFGDLLLVLNSAFFAVFLVLSKSVARRMDPLGMAAGMFLLGALVVPAAAAGKLAAFDYAGVPAATWWLCGFVVLGPTVGTYVLNFYALKRLPTSMVAVFIYLQFIVGVALGVLWQKEAITWRLAVSSALILGGLGLRMLELRARDQSPVNTPAARF